MPSFAQVLRDLRLLVVWFSGTQRCYLLCKKATRTNEVPGMGGLTQGSGAQVRVRPRNSIRQHGLLLNDDCASVYVQGECVVRFRR